MSYDWKDTNLKLFGSKMDHEVKSAAGELEEAWEGIGKQAGTYVWRVENFQIKPWPKDRYGQFFRGDSYVVLQSVGSDPANLKHDVHIWIGSYSTQDEYGTAACKMVEAVKYLEGAAVQHRQIEGREATDFVNLFGHLEYLKGGIDSVRREIGDTAPGLKDLAEFEPKLFRVDGDPSKPLEQVAVGKAVGKNQTGPCFDRSSLDGSDVFLLDTGWKIFVWMGNKADRSEIFAAMSAADRYAKIDPRVHDLPVTMMKAGREPDGFSSFFE